MNPRRIKNLNEVGVSVELTAQHMCSLHLKKQGDEPFPKLTGGDDHMQASVLLPSPPNDWLICFMFETLGVFQVGEFRVLNSQSEGN